MFSGIIASIGTVRTTRAMPDALEIVVDTGFDALEAGESIAVNGVCLTVTDAFDAATGIAPFVLSRETLDRTSLVDIGVGARINLERAVTAATRLSGHIVQGHVDGVGRVMSVAACGPAWHVRIGVPGELRRYMVEKGSISIDGISLTINALEATATGATIGLMIVPHTWSHTVLSDRAPGDLVNIEVDVIAKYVESLGMFRNPS